MHFMSRTRATWAGGAGSFLLLLWKAYSSYTTAIQLPDDMRRALKVLEQSPPWFLFVPFALLFVWGVWPRRKATPAVATEKASIPLYIETRHARMPSKIPPRGNLLTKTENGSRSGDTIFDQDVEIWMDRIPGEGLAEAFFKNETPHYVALMLKSASVKPVGGSPAPAVLDFGHFGNVINLFPAERFDK